MLLLGLLGALGGTPSSTHAQESQTKPVVTLQGKLVIEPGSVPALRAKGKETRLGAVKTYYYHTLQDPRLLNREIRVEGDWAADGTLMVSKFYTVKNGKLYRIRYFCEVCNIEAYEPGNCECCQQPTELQEIPADTNP